MKLIVSALSKLKERPGSEEFRAAVDMLKIGSKVVPDLEEGLGQPELQAMQGALRPPGQPGMTPNALGFMRPQPRIAAGPPMMGGMR